MQNLSFISKLPLLCLFLTLPASGVVIYRTSDIRVGNILADPPYVRSFLMDVNNDGITDWTIGTHSTQYFSDMSVVAPPTTLFIYRTGKVLLNEFTPLSIDDPIGPILGNPDYRLLNITDAFSNALATSSIDGGFGGPFSGKTAYLGFRFEAATGSHYGYALLQEVTSSSAIITAYAWESEPDTAILAGAIPEPSAALLLTVTSLLALTKRRRT
ncbi:hypothetical protein V2O64_18600 [Verrucomicrobiaceae bacterium 227]